MDYFTADLHLNSSSIMLRENRPFRNALKMSRKIIANINRVAGYGDTVYIIGDVVSEFNNTESTWKEALPFMKSLHAKVILFMGNNEERVVERYFDSFESFKKYCYKQNVTEVLYDHWMKINGMNVHLNHYPTNYDPSMFNLFGHTHRSTGLWKPWGLNVGCDLNNYSPFSTHDIMYLYQQKTNFWDSDMDVYSI